MKIAMIGQKGAPALFGGIERHVEELSVELARHGHEVTIFCRAWYSPAFETPYRGTHLVLTPAIHTKHLDAISHTFFSILTAHRRGTDVYHFHGVGPALLAWLPRVLDRRARIIVTFHGLDRKHAKWGPLSRLALRCGEWMACRMADQTITVSKTLQKYCLQTYQTKTIYIPNGVSAPFGSRSELLSPFGLEPEHYVMFVARLVPNKRAHDLLRAWKSARQARPALFSGLKLVIVGGSTFSDGYVRQLHRLAHQETSIVFTGYQSGTTLNALFTHTLAVVNPSEFEGLSLITLEAMSHGKPVIASDIPENLELAEHDGIIYRLGKVSELAERLIWLCEHPDLAKKVGQRAKKMVRQNFTWPEIARQTDQIYRHLPTENKIPTPLTNIVTEKS